MGEHNHEHQHGHEHHHVHLRGSFRGLGGEVKVEVTQHEQAAVASMLLQVEPGGSVAFSTVVAYLQALAERAEAAGGIVGHIKAFAREGELFANASVTSTDATEVDPAVLPFEFGSGADIQLVAIVLCLEPEALLDLVLQS